MSEYGNFCSIVVRSATKFSLGDMRKARCISFLPQFVLGYCAGSREYVGGGISPASGCSADNTACHSQPPQPTCLEQQKPSPLQDINRTFQEPQRISLKRKNWDYTACP